MLVKPEPKDFQAAWIKNPRLLYMTRECLTCRHTDGILIASPDLLYRFSHCVCNIPESITVQAIDWDTIATHYNAEFHRPEIKQQMKNYWFPTPQQVKAREAERNFVPALVKKVQAAQTELGEQACVDFIKEITNETS